MLTLLPHALFTRDSVIRSLADLHTSLYRLPLEPRSRRTIQKDRDLHDLRKDQECLPNLPAGFVSSRSLYLTASVIDGRNAGNTVSRHKYEMQPSVDSTRLLRRTLTNNTTRK